MTVNCGTSALGSVPGVSLAIHVHTYVLCWQQRQPTVRRLSHAVCVCIIVTGKREMTAANNIDDNKLQEK